MKIKNVLTWFLRTQTNFMPLGTLLTSVLVWAKENFTCVPTIINQAAVPQLWWKIPLFFLLYLLIYLFIYLFLAVLGLRFCARAFSSCGERGPLFIAVRGPLTIAASLVGEHRLQTRRLSSCGSRTQVLRGIWDLPRPGLEPVSPALAGRFSTTAPPGKPPSFTF